MTRPRTIPKPPTPTTEIVATSTYLDKTKESRMSATTLVSIIHGVVAVCIIAAVTVLLALHDLSEPTALALYGVAITLVGGTMSTALAAQIPTKSQQ